MFIFHQVSRKDMTEMERENGNLQLEFDTDFLFKMKANLIGGIEIFGGCDGSSKQLKYHKTLTFLIHQFV